MDKLLEIYCPTCTKQELAILENITKDDKPKLKPIFHLKGFIFGVFYLLFKKAYMEALAVFVISLLVIQIGFILHSFIFLGLGLILQNLLVGFFFYFMFGNKFLREVDNCGTPIDKECLASKGGHSWIASIGSLIFLFILFWPVIYGAITKQNVTTEQNKYINKIMKKLK